MSDELTVRYSGIRMGRGWIFRFEDTRAALRSEEGDARRVNIQQVGATTGGLYRRAGMERYVGWLS